MQCTNNFKQVGIALHNYHDSLEAFPAFTAQVGDGNKWRPVWLGLFFLLPYMEIGNCYESDILSYGDVAQREVKGFS